MKYPINRRIYVDQDGVLADFDAHFSIITGIPWKSYSPSSEKLTSASWAQKWDAIEKQGTFYRDLPLMPGALELWEFLLPFDPCVLTAKAKSTTGCREQKIEWCKRYLKGIIDDRIIVVDHRDDKQRYCEPGDVLIDDRPSNIADWQIAGGYGILHVFAAQTIAELTEIFSK